MEIAEHIEAVRDQGDLLADAAERAGLDAAVPPCPPWLVKDLLRHTGYIHRWAARHITECPETLLDGPPEDDILRGGAADPDLLAWFRAGHAALVETLSTADPGLRCATFMDAPTPLAFWARRQAHETAIHRADAEGALGIRPGYAPDFAADGIDELIMGFGQRRKYRPAAEHGGSLAVRTTDTGHAWRVAAEDGRLQAAASRPRRNPPPPRPGGTPPPRPGGTPLPPKARSAARPPACTCSCGTGVTPPRPASPSPAIPASSRPGSQASASAGADQADLPEGSPKMLGAIGVSLDRRRLLVAGEVRANPDACACRGASADGITGED